MVSYKSVSLGLVALVPFVLARPGPQVAGLGEVNGLIPIIDGLGVLNNLKARAADGAKVKRDEECDCGGGGGGGLPPVLPPLPPPPSPTYPSEPTTPCDTSTTPTGPTAPPAPPPSPSPTSPGGGGNGGGGGGNYQGQCSTGPVQCCNTVQPASSKQAGDLLEILSAPIQDANVPIGIDCVPINVIGVGNAGSCTSAPVCCQNNSFSGLIAIGCSPIILNA